MKKIRILYLVGNKGIRLEQSGGAGSHIRGTIHGFEVNGAEVLPIIGGDVFSTKISIVATKGKKKKIFTVVKKLVPSKILLLLRDFRYYINSYSLQRKTFSSIQQFKPDVIYERASYLCMYGYRLSKRLNIPIYYETDGGLVGFIKDDYGVFSEWIGNAIERFKILRSTYCVVMNKKAVSDVSSKYGISAKKILVKTLGVFPSEIQVDHLRINDLREMYCLKDKFVVGFVGIISAYHGIEFLIDTIERAGSSFNNIVFLIIGSSKLGEVLQNQAVSKKLSNIVFVGKVNHTEVKLFYQVMQVGIIPKCDNSIYPIKVLEYGLYSVCPLAPRYEVYKEIIVENKNGLHFEPNNSEDLIRVLSEASNDLNRIKTIGKNWNKDVVANFGWENATKEVYASFISNSIQNK